MECTLAALVACFSWSGLYIDTGIQYRDKGLPVTTQVPIDFTSADGRFHTVGVMDSVSYKRENPYGSFAIGFEISGRKWSASLEGFHLSSMSTGRDDGINGVSLGVRVYPFRR